MYSPAVLDHFKSPRNAGVLAEPHGTGRAHNPGCGDDVEMAVRLRDGTVHEIRFRAQGCPALIACASRLTELARGLSAAEAAAVGGEALASALGGLPPTSRHAAVLPVEALRAALAQASLALAPSKNSAPDRTTPDDPGRNSSSPPRGHSSADLPPATTPPRR